MLVIEILPRSPHRTTATTGSFMMNRTVLGCRSHCELGRAERKDSAATRLIANVFQGTDLARRRRGSPLVGSRAVPPIPHADRLQPLPVLTRNPAGNQYT